MCVTCTGCSGGGWSEEESRPNDIRYTYVHISACLYTYICISYICDCVCVKMRGGQDSGKRLHTVVLNKSNDIRAGWVVGERREGTGRDGPLSLTPPPLAVACLTTVRVRACA